MAAATLMLGASPTSSADPKPGAESYREIPKLGDFFGKSRSGPYIRPAWSLVEQVWEGLGSATPIDSVRLEGGYSLLQGCRRHSCDEKAAVVISSTGAVQAVGLVNFHCHFVEGYTELKIGGRRRKVDCEGRQRLTLFLRRSGAYRETLERWADTAVGETLPREVVWIEPRKRG